MIFVLSCIAALAGCATATGTRKEMNVSALSKMDNLEVQVRVDKDFSVSLAGQRMNGLDFLVLSLALTGGQVAARAVAAVNANSKSNEDAQRAQKIRDVIADINVQNLAQKTLVDGFQSTGRFKSVKAANGSPNVPTGTGTFRVRIENWGLYSDRSEAESLQSVQVGLNATASLIGDDGKTAWEHSDYFTGGAKHSFNQYRDSPDLLKTEITETLQRYCTRMVNEIRYTK